MEPKILDTRNTSAPNLTNQPYADDEIDMRALFGVLWAEKKLIAGVTAAAAILSVVMSLLMTEVYRAEITLAPAETEQNSAIGGQFGGAAALLGVNLRSGGGDSVSTALAILQSRQFISRFIDQNELLVPLFAANWDKRSKQSQIDENSYNSEVGQWLLDNGSPSTHDAYRTFFGILSVTGPDRDTGIVKVSITWQNPQEAAKWTNKLVDSLNQEVRARDVREANNAITYLRQQLEQTQLVDMQRVFYQLIESQTRITMLADVRDEYVFRVIDPAVAPDIRSAPRRLLMIIFGTMAGVFFGLMTVFMKRMFYPKREVVSKGQVG